MAPISILGESCLMEIPQKTGVFCQFASVEICNELGQSLCGSPLLLLQVFWVKFWKGWSMRGQTFR